MAKRKFMIPILLSGGLTPGSDGEDPIIGPGSGQTNIEDPYPCGFDEWLIMFASGEDLDGTGEPDDYEDWKFWMKSNGFDWTKYE